MMISSFASSISAVRAASRMMDAAAHNTANLNTNGFKRHEVRLKEGASGGVETSVNVTDSPGPLYRDSLGNTVEGSNADYATEAVNMMTAKHYLTANVAVIRTAEDMHRSVIDILA